MFTFYCSINAFKIYPWINCSDKDEIMLRNKYMLFKMNDLFVSRLNRYASQDIFEVISEIG